MENPFEVISRRLENIEGLLLDLKHGSQTASPQANLKRKPLTGAKAIAEYTGLAESTIYKLTAANELPHSKRGKTLTADPDKLDAWLLANEVGRVQQPAPTSDIYQRRRTRKTAA